MYVMRGFVVRDVLIKSKTLWLINDWNGWADLSRKSSIQLFDRQRFTRSSRLVVVPKHFFKLASFLWKRSEFPDNVRFMIYQLSTMVAAHTTITSAIGGAYACGWICEVEMVFDMYIPVSHVQTDAKGNLDFYSFCYVKIEDLVQYSFSYHNEWVVSDDLFYFVPSQFSIATKRWWVWSCRSG